MDGAGVWPGDGLYDVDHPGLQERVNEMLREVAELFGEETDGMILSWSGETERKPTVSRCITSGHRKITGRILQPLSSIHYSLVHTHSMIGGILLPSVESIFYRVPGRYSGPLGLPGSWLQSMKLKMGPAR